MKSEPQLGDLDQEAHLVIDRYDQVIREQIERGDKAILAAQEAWAKRRARYLKSIGAVKAGAMPVIGLPRMLIEFDEDQDIERIARILAPKPKDEANETEREDAA